MSSATHRANVRITHVVDLAPFPRASDSLASDAPAASGSDSAAAIASCACVYGLGIGSCS